MAAAKKTTAKTAAPVANMFAQAAKVEKAAPKAKKQRPVVEMTDDLDVLAACAAVKKAIEGLMAGVQASVKTEMTEHFAAGLKAGLKPENFRGKSKNAQASCELKKRSSKSTLSTEEVNLLAAHKIGTKKSSEDVYLFNPKILTSESAMAKISAALQDVDVSDDIGEGEQIIMVEEKNTYVVADDAVEQVYALKNEKIGRLLLEHVCTLSVKPSLNINDIRIAFQLLEDNGLKLGNGDSDEAE